MVFLGLLFERSEEKTIAANSAGGFVLNQVITFQWNCLDGLYENDVKDLCIVNALPVGTFPRQYKDLRLPSRQWRYRGGTHYQLGCMNLPVLKQWGRRLACRKMLRKLGDKEIIIYSPYEPYLKAVQKLDSSYKVTLIVPDLPAHYDYGAASGIRKLLRKLNNRSIDKCMSRVDRFVLLTDYMKEPLKVGSRPYTVVEGICTGEPASVPAGKTGEKKIILYTGTLHRKFGVPVLLEAFLKITDPDYELWICGGGDYEEEIRRAAQQDGRITFFGYVSREKAAQLQSQATVLVNPRQNIGEYTKYSFPSKTMEYLKSGIPVVGYPLSGIPREYDDYLHYPKDHSPQALKDTLVAVCSDDSARCGKIAVDAARFVCLEKNPKRQAQRILELIGRQQ